MVNIMSVELGSYAEKAGIRAGDTLVSLNGNEVNDVLDYRFYLFETELKIVIVRDGAALEFTIKKPEYDDIGLEFSTYLMDEKKRCRNNCIFCFIDVINIFPNFFTGKVYSVGAEYGFAQGI